jgi:outer membrane protein assembly factor BamB
MDRHRLLLITVLLAAGAVVTSAALPTFWNVSTESELLRGEVENLAIDSFGRLTLGPTSSTVYDASAPFLWTIVSARDGTLFAGSGNEGQVYRIDASGRGSVFFDTDELEVHAIASIPGGGAYVGTSPDGKIYKVDASGKGAVFFDPVDRYIWSLVVDRSGTVFAATGDKGVIYKIAPDGKGAPFYETKATHAMALAFDRDGRLLAGTESPGRVFRIDASGKPFVLLDSSYSEIRTIRVDATGDIYVAAVSGRPGGGAGLPPPPAEPAPQMLTPSVSAEITVVAIAESPVSPAQPAPTLAPARTAPSAGALFRIHPDGTSDLIWESREDLPYDVAFEPGGTLLVATGNKGKIYRLSGDPLQPTLVARVNAQQVTSLQPEREGRMIVATSNPGRLLVLSATRADRGTYTSDVRDAQTVATWGTIKWQEGPTGGRVEISTRSGNTRTPDETWSDWTAPYADRDGSPITSPRARYLQWRAVLIASRGQSPYLTSVTAAYLPRNLRPRVTSITIHPPGTVFQRPFPTDPEIAGFEGDLLERRAAAAQGSTASPPSLGRRAYQKGLLTIVWRAEDDNRDDLAYDVLYRREGETSWKTLKRSMSEAILVWDTSSVPNGRYFVRVVAADAPSNSPGTALSGAMESTSFEIDNTPPVITVTSVRRDASRVTIAFDVRDANSAVQKADYSLDGDRWQTIYPRDGISDSRFEQFELVLEGEAAARGVILRASDALNNVSSARGEAPEPSGRR